MKNWRIKIGFENGEVRYDWGGHGMLVADPMGASCYSSRDLECVMSWWRQVKSGDSPRPEAVRRMNSPIDFIRKEMA